MKEKIKVFYIDKLGSANPEGTKPLVMDIEPTLDAYYELLDCSTIDITSRKIGGKYFDIILDDEGLLKGSPVVTAVDSSPQRKPMLVGNLIICNMNDEGEEVSLSDDDVELIADNIIFAMNRDRDARTVLVCDY